MLATCFKALKFCIPTKSTIVPHGPDWLHEVKDDVYRLRVERSRAAVTIGPTVSRALHAKRCPPLGSHHHDQSGQYRAHVQLTRTQLIFCSPTAIMPRRAFIPQSKSTVTT